MIIGKRGQGIPGPGWLNQAGNIAGGMVNKTAGGAGLAWGAGQEIGRRGIGAVASIITPNKASFFAVLTIIGLYLEWGIFKPTDFWGHLVFQIIFMFGALIIIGHDEELTLRIANIFAWQSSILFAFSMMNSMYGSYSNLWDSVVPYLIILLVICIALTIFAGRVSILFLKETAMKLYIPIIAVGIFLALPLFGLTRYLIQDSLGNIIEIAAIFQTILMFILTSLWMWWALIHASEGENKFGKIILFAFVFLLIAVIVHRLYVEGYIGNAYTGEVGPNPVALGKTIIIDGIAAGKFGLIYINQTANNIGNNTEQLWDEVTDPNFETRVENQRGSEVGVSLEAIETFIDTPYIHQEFTLYSTVKGKTVDKPLPITLSCSAKESSSKAEEVIEGKVQNNKALITTTQSHAFICSFDENTLEAKSYNIDFKATFPFTTSSYTKRYIMDEDNYYSLLSQDIDPLEQYDIRDKNPATIYTPGPLDVAVGTLDPTIILPSDGTKQTYLYLTLEKRGPESDQLHDITRLAFYIPKGFQVVEKNGALDCIGANVTTVHEVDKYRCFNGYCIDDIDNFNTYSVTPKSIPKEDDKYKKKITIGCNVQALPSMQVLQNQPISIVSFRAVVDYNFSTSKKKYITMKKATNIHVANKTAFIDGMTISTLLKSDIVENPDAQQIAAAKVYDTTNDDYFAFVYGIGRAHENQFDDEYGCYGGQCGITKYNMQMVRKLNELNLLDETKTDDKMIEKHQTNDPTQITPLSPEITLKYITNVLKPLCKEDIPECIVGKYLCGTSYVYQDTASCTDTASCEYCDTVWAPKAMSYAYNYFGSKE